MLNVTANYVTYQYGNESGDGNGNIMRYEPYGFLGSQPVLSISIIVILVAASIVGSFGNILILVAVATQRDLQNMESVFIVNLACSDLYVTVLVDPLSIVGKIQGWRFFEAIPTVCRAIASLCTISCVGSLMTLAALSCNRYVLICHPRVYNRLFTTRSSVLMCFAFYLVGFLLVALNFVGVGDHSFDHKSLECIWDRMANHNYTIVFAIVMVIIPITVTGLAYLRLYIHVRKSTIKINNHAAREISKEGSSVNPLPSDSDGNKNGRGVSPDQDVKRLNKNVMKILINLKPMDRTKPKVVEDEDSGVDGKVTGGGRSSTVRLARTLFIIYLLFSLCWLPFALLIMLDADDSFAHELHVAIVAWAHLHPSINWLVYYFTHNKFRVAFLKLFRQVLCWRTQ